MNEAAQSEYRRLTVDSQERKKEIPVRERNDPGMPRRAVELAPIDVGATSVKPGGQDSAGGPIRSSKRSARRKSPYDKKPSPAVQPGPPTTGLSDTMGGMMLGTGSVTRSRSRRGFTLEADQMLSFETSKGPVARQRKKEEEWKSRLAREKSSW